ncbi:MULTISPECIES: DUF3841 domain-containing protein [unclassified Paenibacillus]|uniref:DUF3841 domain-containing protein n=1 Tax=Paenibacillus provencensis TaxID=441151 RepID=A0ABW3Q2H5_9BACL|nr:MULTISPECIES: DUF3841 domain-containing protein [unclassified Paenibacillus]SDX70082.1 protein of unknown function [Paenibacillus sp. PDC88]SFS87949.1 protein of unknown function [Paenibacillus sp. 453mf]
MIYWSMQTIEAWEAAQSIGYLEGEPERAMFPDPYVWMIQQMHKRLPNYKGEYPIWLWPKKPDMRSTGHFIGGTKCVRLTLDIDEKDVLISDFDGWHMVLNNFFNSDNEKEAEDFDNGKLSTTLEESWERIFEFDRNVDTKWAGNGEWRQGTTGRIYLDKVKKVEHFVTRKSADESRMK